MKLSEAIRLGAMLRPQTFASFFGDDGSCAIGAASEAAGLRVGRAVDVDGLRKMWAPIWAIKAQCPVCDKRRGVASIIGHINDDHRWTRDQIADWVESIESEQEQEQQEQLTEQPVAAMVQS